MFPSPPLHLGPKAPTSFLLPPPGKQRMSDNTPLKLDTKLDRKGGRKGRIKKQSTKEL